MKKNMRLLIAGLLLCALLAACGHQHIWLEATCQAPKTCTDCGATEGTAAEHSWNDATCQAPKTCAKCGATEGDVADHNWNNATCQAPKTCTECGATEGDVAEHNWNYATCQAPKTCTECGATEGDVADHYWNDATCQTPKTCTECGVTEGTPIHDYGLWGEAELDSSGQWIHSRSCKLCGDLQTEEVDDPTVRTDLGSASSPEGTTLIISIFANELNTSWDFETEEDRATRALMLDHMESATTWLTQQIGTYGVESQFIYDWEAYPDLCFSYDFGQLILVRPDGGGYWKQETYILENIPTETLKDKYQAQNVIYMFYFNTDETNTVNSWTLSDRQIEESEIINVFVRDNLSDSFYYMPASSLAHEIMHCFGAHDLYYASDAIPQAYVDHCGATDSMDIMYTISLGSTIPQLFTRLDAYYLGLVDSCDEVDAWGLGKSTYLE